MKPIKLNELFLHEKSNTLSFFQAPIKTPEDLKNFELFFTDLVLQLKIRDDDYLTNLIVKNHSNIKKILKSHPDKSHGFFFSKNIQGYIILQKTVSPYYMLGHTFHVRPVLEELFVNPEFLLVNISLYDIKIYRADFQHIEIIQQYEFDELPKNFNDGEGRVYAPQYLGLVPYKTILALKTIAQKIKDMILYESLPVVITGLDEMKNIFLRYLDESAGVITSFYEDFYEKSCMEILARCERFRYAVTDYYSAQLKERLKRMIKSRHILSDLGEVIRAIFDGRVIQLVIPSEQKIWGTIDSDTGEFTIHKRAGKTSVDILNELAGEVIKQGGRIKILGPHFFPQNTSVLAILKGN